MPNLENSKLNNSILDSFDIENISIENLLFQTGYLTIKGVENMLGENYYLLQYPDYGVRLGINNRLISHFTPIDSTDIYNIKNQLIDVILNEKVDRLKEVLKSFYASIPYQWYARNNLQEYEEYYASVLYALVASTGLELKVKDSSNRGRVDMMVEYDKKRYVIEFKVIEDDKEKGGALQHVEVKQYHEKSLVQARDYI